MEQNKPPKKFNKKILIVILSIITVVGVFGHSMGYFIEKNGVYTIGIVYKTDYSGKAGAIRCYYYYIYKKKKHTSSFLTYEGIGIKDIGKRFFIQILPNFPSQSKVFPTLYVPDSITEAPYEGWKELPVPVQE